MVDINDPQRNEKAKAVIELLTELQLEAIPRITVYNKADLVTPREAALAAIKEDAVAVSAQTGEGLRLLVSMIAHRLWQTEALAADDAWASAARREIFGDRAASGSGYDPEVAAGWR